MSQEIDIQLINCAGSGDQNGVMDALKKGADVKSKEPQIGATALGAVSVNGNIEIMKLLLDAKSDVNAADNNGMTPLFYCAAKGNTEGVKLLLDKGADISARNANSETPLMRPAMTGWVEIVRLLLDKGADPNAQGTEGSTVLMLAADNGHTEVVKLLLGKGAKKEAKHPYSYKTAYDYARRNGHQEIEELLKPIEAGFNKQIMDLFTKLERKPGKKLSAEEQTTANERLIDAIKKKNLSNVIIEIEGGADINAKVGNDYPIVRATYTGQAEIVELLIKLGADVNAEEKEPYDLRAISIACGGGFTDIVKLLLDNGAEVKKVFLVANDRITKLLKEAQQ